MVFRNYMLIAYNEGTGRSVRRVVGDDGVVQIPLMARSDSFGEDTGRGALLQEMPTRPDSLRKAIGWADLLEETTAETDSFEEV